MFVDGHAGTGKRVAPRCFLNLQDPVADLDRVVAVHHAFLLHRKDPLQVLASPPQKGAARLRRRNTESPVELRDVFLAQKPVRCFWRSDSAQAQLLRQTPLPGAKTPLAASSRLRRVSRDHANPPTPAWLGPLGLPDGDRSSRLPWVFQRSGWRGRYTARRTPRDR